MVKLCNSISAINGKFKINSKINIPSVNIYNALFLYLFLCLCESAFPVVLISSLAMLISYRPARLAVPAIVTLARSFFGTQEWFMSGLTIFFLIIGLILCEHRIKAIAKANSSNSYKHQLILFIFSAIAVILIDYSAGGLHAVLDGLKFTYYPPEPRFSTYRVINFFIIFNCVSLAYSLANLKKTPGAGRIGSGIVFNLLFLIGAINYWVTAITGKALIPSDIFIAKTAFGVIAGVQVQTRDVLMFAAYIILVIAFNIALNITLKKAPSEEPAGRINFKALTTNFACLMTMVLFLNQFSPLMYDSVRRLGLPVHLIASAKRVSKPTDYDSFLASMQLSNNGNTNESSTRKPNIIVIMSEAFSDLSLDGELKTNEDYMPFIRSLMKDQPSGVLYSSVLGNNTVSSEYEFLTGIPTAFTDKGSTIYQRYLDEQEPSIVSLLEGQGYNTIGIHPYNGEGYNRNKAWESFGFNETYFSDSFKNPEKVRDYISDKSFYEKIIEAYEDNKENGNENANEKTPLFCFGISMQNHATYLSKKYEGDIKADNFDSPELDEYLSLIKETDQATKDLISYFESVDEDTMIVFFGDHQPMLATETYEKLCGDDEWKKYQVPYFIWTNFDTDVTVPEEASINYLPNIVLDAAGIAKDPWFTFTGEVFQDYPVITDNYIKIEDDYIPKSEMISKLKDIEAKDADSPLYSLKQLQVQAYHKALD